MNLQLLRTFLCVRKHLNYTRAGKELFLSQPAVSRQIKQLENEFGIQLIEQLGKSLHLTKAGQTLVVESEMLLGAMERTKEAVQAHSSAGQGSLRIGTSSTPGCYMLPEVLGAFHQKFPEIKLKYVSDNSQRVEQMIIDNSLDLGFVGAYLSNDDLRLEPVMEDEVVCFASPAHPLSDQRRITPQQLSDTLCIVRERGSSTRRFFESWLSDKDVKLGKVIEVQSSETVKKLVTACLGFSFMSIHGLKDELRDRKLILLDVASMPLPRQIYLVHHAKKHFSPIIRAFLEILKNTDRSGLKSDGSSH
ncbi:MAG: LysR substrate-binding domain-containing protein [Limisphaerales bacterium]